MNNDRQLHQSVIDALAWEASITSTHIGIDPTVSGNIWRSSIKFNLRHAPVAFPLGQIG